MIFTVSDDTDTTAFLGFDMEVARLPNIQASQAAQIVVSPIINHAINFYYYFA